MIVVPVLMISCQVSEYWKIGPVIAHTTTTPEAITNVDARPAACDAAFAAFANNCPAYLLLPFSSIWASSRMT